MMSAHLALHIKGEIIVLDAVLVAPPEAEAAVHRAHGDLQQDDEADLHVQEAVERACAAAGGLVRT